MQKQIDINGNIVDVTIEEDLVEYEIYSTAQFFIKIAKGSVKNFLEKKKPTESDKDEWVQVRMRRVPKSPVNENDFWESFQAIKKVVFEVD